MGIPPSHLSRREGTCKTFDGVMLSAGFRLVQTEMLPLAQTER